MTDAQTSMQRLLDLLTLEEVGTAHISVDDAPGTDESFGERDASVYLGQSAKTPHGRIFGGQVLAQGVMAAGRTIDATDGEPPRPIHSLHAYFMRPGDDTQPIRFAVERMMDGRSFATRRAHALQFGRPILAMSASFQVPAGGIDHQDQMPDVPGPDELASLDELLAGADPTTTAHLADRPIEQRPVGGLPGPDDPESRRPATQVWMRTHGRLPDDPLIHAAVLAYASDYGMLQPAIRRHGITFRDPRLRIASLDHAMWFHRPGRLDEWMLFDLQSPSAQGGRGLGVGNIFAQDGTLVATVAQEGMMRVKEA